MAFQTIHRLAYGISLLLGPTLAYTGGVAIRYPNSTCPDGTFYIGTSLAANCCSDGTYGAASGSSYCCPTDSDCKTTVENLIQCSNSTWTYFPSPDNQPIGFCCLPGWQGYVQSDSDGNHEGVACAEPGAALGTNQATVPSLQLAAQRTVTVGATATSSPATSPATLTTTTASASTSLSAAASASASSSIASSTSSPSSGLSTGAQAGIGVGVSVGVIAMAGIFAVWFLRRRKRAARVESQPEVESKADAAQAAPGDGAPVAPVESGGKTYSEMEATPVSELENEVRIHELSADSHSTKTDTAFLSQGS